MTVEVHVVDAFTDRSFAGNPAGVVLLSEPADPAWMQSVAAELKHAETAFVVMNSTVEGPVDGALPLRWFTPTAEVDLCGHATLAAAHVLGGVRRFATASGELVCTPVGDGWIEMDFPADPPTPATVEPDPLTALPGVTARAVLRGRFDVLVEASSAAEVRALRPDLDLIEKIDARGVVVTAPGDVPGVDCVSRCFYPAYGVPEDPVTGSAHCTLAAWWSARLGRATLVGEQASPRGGTVRMTVEGDRVRLAGRAVSVLRGELLV
ncbi:PhzF family phenazine biosynthesis protein [Streptoalloteichus hindustanus]|uniref:Phenazine biosynthesis protein PhzF family n=1 Tax=Streptoalloteichus hindustanus TaxID=2017 RepID=A0A1M4TLM2_STRHI|nr:PhzF family phenazine biosynthesis protein [Streptoalloteichus hindustanus]SHE45361.1 phenazine biosynthesis protein PhzF family [Streptoalloteichus hindustanus]